MFKSRIFLLIGAVLVISALKVLGQRPKKCADYDEYCQLHSDCCSNSCLTYLYRCTRNYNGIYPYTFFGEKIPTIGTLEDVVAMTFSNFGSVDEMRRHQNAQQMQQSPYGFGTRFSDDEIGAGDKLLDNQEDINEQTTTSSTIEEVTTSKQPEQEAEPEQLAASNDNNSERDGLAVETRISEAAAECKQIASKCYKNEECCTKRCHGFLHLCVT